MSPLHDSGTGSSLGRSTLLLCALHINRRHRHLVNQVRMETLRSCPCSVPAVSTPAQPDSPHASVCARTTLTVCISRMFLRAGARSSTVVHDSLNPATNVIWSRCVARLLCVDTGQRDQDGGDDDAAGRPRALHVPERLDAIFRTRPRERPTRVVCWRVVGHRSGLGKDHDWWTLGLKVCVLDLLR